MRLTAGWTRSNVWSYPGPMRSPIPVGPLLLNLLATWRAAGIVGAVTGLQSPGVLHGIGGQA